MRGVSLALGLLPHSRQKIWLLRHVLGWRIDRDCVIAPVIADVRHVSLGPGVRIGAGNVFRNLESLTMAARSHIGHWNWITSAPDFAALPAYGHLTMDEEAAITSSHYLDCSGSITIGRYSTIGGRRSTLLTHEADYQGESLSAEPVRIGAYCLINSNVCITPGCDVANGVVVAMGAVVAGDLDRELTLYAGVPAVAKKKVQGGYFSRTDGRLRLRPRDVPSASPSGANHDGKRT